MDKEAKTLLVHQVFLGLKATLTGTMWKKHGMMIVELINFEGKCHLTWILCRRPSYSDTFGWQFQIYNVPSMYMTYLSMLISYVHGCSESLLTVKNRTFIFHLSEDPTFSQPLFCGRSNRSSQSLHNQFYTLDLPPHRGHWRFIGIPYQTCHVILVVTGDDCILVGVYLEDHPS